MLQIDEYVWSIAVVIHSHGHEAYGRKKWSRAMNMHSEAIPPLCPRLPTSRQILGRAWVGSWGELARYLEALGREIALGSSLTMPGGMGDSYSLGVGECD